MSSEHAGRTRDRSAASPRIDARAVRPGVVSSPVIRRESGTLRVTRPSCESLRGPGEGELPCHGFGPVDQHRAGTLPGRERTKVPNRPYALVLGTAYWDQTIATNQHYIVRELCRDGFARVEYFESLGLRRPRVSVYDTKRILQRALRVMGGPNAMKSEPRPKPDGLVVRSPFVVPAAYGAFEGFNSLSLRRLARTWIDYPGPRILWTYSPVTYGLPAYADRVIYHCTDLLGEVSGIDPAEILEGERELARLGAQAIGSSRVVADHLEEVGFKDVILWENVADSQFISARIDVDAHPRVPRAIFGGNITPDKLNLAIIEALADAGVAVTLAGPYEGAGTRMGSWVSRMQRKGVEYLGALDDVKYATELVTSTVGIIPYELNSYTRGVSPLKMYEYLAAGLAVVSSPLPSVGERRPDVSLVPPDDPAEWVRRVSAVIATPSQEDVERRLALAAAHSWVTRGELARDMVRSG